MEVRRYLSIARRRLLLIIAIGAAALTAGWLITPRADVYTASSTLYVGSRSIDIEPTSGEVSGERVAGLDRLIKTFTAMLKSDVVARGAVERGEIPRSPTAVVAATRAEQVPETNLIRVSVTDRDPVIARALANEVAESFTRQVEEFEPREAAEDTSTPTDIVSVYEEADLPSVPVPSGLLRNLVLAGLFGLLVAGGVVALLEHLDISLRSTDDVERRLELPVLGVVPALGDELPVTPPTSVAKLSATPQRRRPEDAPVG